MDRLVLITTLAAMLGCAEDFAAPPIPPVASDRFVASQLLINGALSDGVQTSIAATDSVAVAFVFSSADSAGDGRAGVIQIAKPGKSGWVIVASQRVSPQPNDEGRHAIVAKFPPLPLGTYRLKCDLAGDDAPIISQKLAVK